MANSSVNNQQSLDQRVIDDVEVNINIIYTKVQSPIHKFSNVKFDVLFKIKFINMLLFLFDLCLDIFESCFIRRYLCANRDTPFARNSIRID